MQSNIELAEYHPLADQTLEHWAEALEAADPEGTIDVNLEDGILTITIEANGQQFVLNKHTPMRQLWLSSPMSGAYHCNWEGNRWVATNGKELAKILTEDVKQAASLFVELV